MCHRRVMFHRVVRDDTVTRLMTRLTAQIPSGSPRRAPSSRHRSIPRPRRTTARGGRGAPARAARARQRAALRVRATLIAPIVFHHDASFYGYERNFMLRQHGAIATLISRRGARARRHTHTSCLGGALSSRPMTSSAIAHDGTTATKLDAHDAACVCLPPPRYEGADLYGELERGGVERRALDPSSRRCYHYTGEVGGVRLWLRRVDGVAVIAPCDRYTGEVGGVRLRLRRFNDVAVITLCDRYTGEARRVRRWLRRANGVARRFVALAASRRTKRAAAATAQDELSPSQQHHSERTKRFERFERPRPPPRHGRANGRPLHRAARRSRDGPQAGVSPSSFHFYNIQTSTTTTAATSRRVVAVVAVIQL